MASVLAPFGMRAAYHLSGVIRPTGYMALASGYSSAIYQGSPVTITGGKLALATAGAGNRIAGNFLGVEYVDATGKPNWSNYWPAAQATLGSVDAKAYVNLDPDIVYEIQADGSVAQTAVGSQAALKNAGSGSAQLGTSTAVLDSTTISSVTANQLRIIGITPGADNVFGDTYTIVQVMVSQHVNVASQNPY